MTAAAPALVTLLLLSATSLRASNDSFAEATDLSNEPLQITRFIGGTGTAESGEPAHVGAPAAQSFWFQWKPSFSGPVGFGEWLNGTGSRLAVYTGDSLATLVPVAQGTERVFFSAVAGVRYHLVIDSAGTDVIYLRGYPPGGSDEMADATVIPATLPRHIQGNNIFATAAPTDEDWHPDYPPTSTVWWKWTAPATGAIRIDTRLSDFGTMIWVGERPPAGSLARVAVGFDAAAFPVTAGNDYFFSIDQSGGGPGTIDFWLDAIPPVPPANDAIANAVDLGSATIACDGGWIRFATPEAGLPNEDPGYPEWGIVGDHTLWWKWTCPHSGHYRFSLHGSDGAQQINVYTGTPALLGFAGGTENADGVRLAATAGTTYWIQVRDWRKFASRTEINIHPAETEPAYFTHFSRRGLIRLRGTQRHPAADPDGDGFTNELEFACGANPEEHRPDDPLLPHLLPTGTGGWKFQWYHDTGYTLSPAVDVTLQGKVALSPAGPWVTTATFGDPATGATFLHLPAANRAFARLELVDPNWQLPP
jgi:hypothetical protein